MAEITKHNPETKIVGKSIEQETTRDKNVDPKYQPVAIKDEPYKLACAYIKDGCEAHGKEMLSEDLAIQFLCYYLNHYQKIREIYPQYPINSKQPYKCCLTAMPTNELNVSWSEEEINGEADPNNLDLNKGSRYFHILFVNQNNGNTDGFSMDRGCKYFAQQPQYIQENCSFEIRYGEKRDKDFDFIFNSFLEKFNNLRAFFELPALDPETIKKRVFSKLENVPETDNAA